MSRTAWHQVALPENETGECWELFHENSKTSKHDQPVMEKEVRLKMANMWESLPYEGFPTIDLPEDYPQLGLALEEAILSRETARNIQPVQMTLNQLAALLHYSYGITRDKEVTNFPRSFRVVPSGGALYPLELYVHSSYVEGLAAGVYHFNSVENRIRLIREGDQTRQLSQALVQPNLPLDSSLMIFVTAIFERSTFKYGDRGYRFVLIEAGHVAQNLNLVANGLGLGTVNIGGYFDRQIDSILGLDGINHSTIYLMGVGCNEREKGETKHY